VREGRGTEGQNIGRGSKDALEVRGWSNALKKKKKRNKVPLEEASVGICIPRKLKRIPGAVGNGKGDVGVDWIRSYLEWTGIRKKSLKV